MQQSLDDKEYILSHDPSNVLGSIGMFADQCDVAWKEATLVSIPDEYKTVENIVVCGMGGSRFTPRTIKELFQSEITRPYEIVDGYTLPGYVNEKSLVILSSYSGTTEETISCGKEAIAKHAKIIAIAHSGDIIKMAKENSFPYYAFDAVKNPCGQPRIGGGYLLMGHMAFLRTLGFLTLSDSDVQKAIAFSRTINNVCVLDIPTEKNIAKQLAQSFYQKHIFLVAAEFMRGYVNGFANQTNENAKQISDFRYIPEMNHHLLEGLRFPESLKNSALFVFLESSLYAAKIQERFAVTKDVITQQHIETKSIVFTGADTLSQVLEGFVLSGHLTFYLSMLNHVDPVAIPWVDYFKKQLA